MTKTLTNEEFGEMMEDAMSLLTVLYHLWRYWGFIEVTVEGTEVTESVRLLRKTTVKFEAVEEEVTEEQQK